MASQGDVLRTFNLTMEESLEADRINGAMIFVISFIGFIVNVFVVFYISYLPSTQNSFGILSRNQCFGDMISCFIFAFYYAPMVFFNLENWQSAEVSQWFSFVQLVCYDAGNMTHLFASINRLSAIFFPVSYNHRFTIRTAHILNITSWVIALVPDFVLYIIVNCHIVYDKLYWKYVFTPDDVVCSAIALHYDFGRSCVLIILTLTMDLFAYVKCRIHRKKMMQSISHQNANSMKLNEINFVTQACLQGVLFGAEMVFWFFISGLMTNRWLKFAFIQLSWVVLTTLDGTMALIFNKEFREWTSKF